MGEDGGFQSTSVASHWTRTSPSCQTANSLSCEQSFVANLTHLKHSSLSQSNGTIPTLLVSSRHLRLDFGEDRFSGTFPQFTTWLVKLSHGCMEGVELQEMTLKLCQFCAFLREGRWCAHCSQLSLLMNCASTSTPSAPCHRRSPFSQTKEHLCEHFKDNITKRRADLPTLSLGTPPDKSESEAKRTFCVQFNLFWFQMARFDLIFLSRRMARV